MKYHLLLPILVILTLVISCESLDNENDRIVGKWQGITWKIEDADSGRDAAAVKFQFNEDDTYSATFGTQEETGTFRLTGNKLYTKAEGKAEKMVQVRLTTSDTLVMDMNRVGTMEELVLVKY